MVDTHFDLARAETGFNAAAASRANEYVSLTAVPVREWSALHARAIEPNAFYSPEWALAVTRHVPGDEDIHALLAWDSPAKKRLIGFLPVTSTWRALKLPLPALVTWHGYVPLATPLLDKDHAVEAAAGLLAAAKAAGAHALILSALPNDGPAAAAIRTALAREHRAPRVLHGESRALLDATADADSLLQEALGSKKLKELRRQRNRLADDGEVRFSVSVSPQQTEAALEQFLKLEAAGWKGKRGTALGSQDGLTRFVKEAVRKLAPQGRVEVATLTRGADVIATGLIVRHAERAYFFKIAHDEKLSKCSPGVQLTLDVTRYLCADEAVRSVDSTATADHPMIDHIWKGRLDIAETLVPLRAGYSAPLFASLISARRTLREGARRIVNRYRAFKEKSS
ncbi:MAG TPA: GNAT family N-acetyltransferase [Xanthobacteraceae bacterium]|nr:GNAT family N-acetyltransferase [Xanthobacteraceae bacterium]